MPSSSSKTEGPAPAGPRPLPDTVVVGRVTGVRGLKGDLVVEVSGGGASQPVATGATTLGATRPEAVRLETAGVMGDTTAACGAATSSLMYVTSVVAVAQVASPDIAVASGSVRLSWQCALGADSCPHTAAQSDVVTGEPVSVSATMYAVM